LQISDSSLPHLPHLTARPARPNQPRAKRVYCQCERCRAGREGQAGRPCRVRGARGSASRSFRGDASFKTWLLTITWHQAINRRRSLSRVWRRLVEPRTEEEAEGVMANVAAASPTPEQAAAQDQLRRAIRRAIRALSPKLSAPRDPETPSGTRA
jgi:hypothetical protein